MFDIEFNPKESFLKQELAVSGVFNNIYIPPELVFGGAQMLIGALGDDGSSDREGRARKRAQRKQSQETRRYNEDVYTYNVREGERQYEYNVETVQLQRENQDRQIQQQQDVLDQRYAYDMSIRDFNYNQAVKIRDQQVRQAEQQIGFNENAFLLGMKQQEVYKEEQELNFEFEQISLDVQQENANYTGRLNERMNDTKQRNTRSILQLQQQANTVEGLKLEGRSRASGQSGRSAGKSVQATFAENGAKQAILAEQTTQAGEQYALTAQQNVNSLDKIYKELFMSNNQLDASRASLKRADIFSRAFLTQEFQQANADALNKIMLMPELAPELPVPPNLSDYARVFQDPSEYKAPPEPRESVPYIPPANPGGNSFLNNTLPIIGQGLNVATSLYGQLNKPNIPNITPNQNQYSEAGFNMANFLIKN